MERAAFDAATASSDVEAASVLELEQQREVLLSVIADVLNMLPPKRREIYELRWLGGIGPRGIAKQLGLSIKTVEEQIARGRARLRAQLHRKQ